MELSQFVSSLSLDNEQAEKFIEDPDSQLQAAGLDTPEVCKIVPALQEVLRAIIWPPPPNRDGI